MLLASLHYTNDYKCLVPGVQRTGTPGPGFKVSEKRNPMQNVPANLVLLPRLVHHSTHSTTTTPTVPLASYLNAKLALTET